MQNENSSQELGRNADEVGLKFGGAVEARARLADLEVVFEAAKVWRSLPPVDDGITETAMLEAEAVLIAAVDHVIAREAGELGPSDAARKRWAGEF
jgi:hypothetical protein